MNPPELDEGAPAELDEGAYDGENVRVTNLVTLFLLAVLLATLIFSAALIFALSSFFGSSTGLVVWALILFVIITLVSTFAGSLFVTAVASVGIFVFGWNATIVLAVISGLFFLAFLILIALGIAAKVLNKAVRKKEERSEEHRDDGPDDDLEVH